MKRLQTIAAVFLCFLLFSSCSDNGGKWRLLMANECGRTVDIFQGSDAQSELEFIESLGTQSLASFDLDYFTSYFFQIRDAATGNTILDEQFWIVADESIEQLSWTVCE